jgi:hypothetical protein
MSDLSFRCARCGEWVPAGGGWAIQKLVDTHIIAGEGKPVGVPAVLACREYLDQLPAVEEFLQEHRDHPVVFEAVDGTGGSPGNAERPGHYRPVPFKDDLVLIRAGGRFVRSDFIIGRRPVSDGEFQAVIEGKAVDHEVADQVKQAAWAEAIRYCNLLSVKEGKPPAYDEAAGVLLDGAGNPARDITEVEGYRLPTGSEWDYAARGGRPDPPYADWGAVLDRIYWDDPTSHYAKPIPPKAPVVNAAGLAGMLGFVREWCVNLLPGGECRRLLCGWSTYETNYDCNLAWTGGGEAATDGARVPFRVALSGNCARRA